MFRFQTVYTIRIIYAGGISQDFDCYDFTITPSVMDRTYKWTAAEGSARPLVLGIDHIHAIYVLKTRKKFEFKFVGWNNATDDNKRGLTGGGPPLK
jgi:hypothetical protein